MELLKSYLSIFLSRLYDSRFTKGKKRQRTSDIRRHAFGSCFSNSDDCLCYWLRTSKSRQESVISCVRAIVLRATWQRRFSPVAAVVFFFSFCLLHTTFLKWPPARSRFFQCKVNTFWEMWTGEETERERARERRVERGRGETDRKNGPLGVGSSDAIINL